MRRFAALVLPLALAGCAESLPAAAPGPAPAPARTVVTWQQFCEQAYNVQHASSLVAARGAEGWELVAMYNGVLCYKRPVGEAPVYRPASVQAQPAGPPGSTYVPVVRDPGF